MPPTGNDSHHKDVNATQECVYTNVSIILSTRLANAYLRICERVGRIEAEVEWFNCDGVLIDLELLKLCNRAHRRHQLHQFLALFL